jgi:acetyltransferase-like isoleucine patch superfamily enzyme
MKRYFIMMAAAGGVFSNEYLDHGGEDCVGVQQCIEWDRLSQCLHRIVINMSAPILTFVVRKYRAFLRDPRGRVMRRLDLLGNNLQTLWSTFVCKILAISWGIQISPNCRFVGLAQFMKHPESIIVIGSNCTFRSSARSNFIGINRPCILSTHTSHAHISIGSGCGFSGTVIGAAKKITIGNKVMCGANVTITDFDWHTVDAQDRHTAGQSPGSAVEIEDNVWIGLNALILKGVHIGRNSVIGANSVVVSSVPANVVAAGNPARVVRQLNFDEGRVAG